MVFLPNQAAPVARDRVARRPHDSGVTPSVCVTTPIGSVCVGPFLDEGVSPSLCLGPLCLGPFAASDAL